MAVNFYLDNRTDKKGDAPIRTSITILGVRLLTSTGYKIAPTKWDAARQQVRRGCTNAAGITYATINTALTKIADHFTAYENKCITSNSRPDADALKREFADNFDRKQKSSRPAAPKSFFDFYDAFISEMGTQNQWTRGTMQIFDALKNHLKTYKQTLSFADLNEKGLNNFMAFLRDDCKMKNTTIRKQLGYLKWFLRWADERGYNSTSDYRTFSPKLKTAAKKVVFLEWDELMKIYNYKIPENGTVVKLTDASGQEYEKTVHDAAGLAKTRDIFCFCCFTSLRYSDAANLKRSDINGETLTITTVKTNDTITIEINKYARAILDKYAGRTDLGGFVFPHITNQRMNEYIKDLCELCGLNQPITQTYYKGAERIDETAPKYKLIGTHTGRRTFICNALILGIPAEIVMKWTGHSDYKAMRPYIDITNAAKAEAMNKFNSL